MGKQLLFLSLCVWALSACNLALRSPDSGAAPPTANQTNSRAGQVYDQAATPQLSARCYPRGDWPQYTVMAGDTLSGIAVRSNSSAAELAAANCLANPNLLVAGQSLYVRQIPVAATPTHEATDTLEQNRNNSVH
jgi:hypothetical protein